jgi:hypothetical protein
MVLLAGCSTLSYQEPTSGPRARVRFATETLDASLVYSYDDQSCRTNEIELVRLRNGVLVSGAPKRLGLPLWSYHENAAKEFYVASGKPSYFMFTGTSTSPYDRNVYSCGVAFSLNFVADTDYEVIFNWHPTQCRVFVNKLLVEGGEPRRVRMMSFDNKLTPQTADCYAKFTKMRLFP